MSTTNKCRVCLERDIDELTNLDGRCRSCQRDSCVAADNYIFFHDSVGDMYQDIGQAIRHLEDLLKTTGGRRHRERKLIYTSAWLEINNYAANCARQAIIDLTNASHNIMAAKQHLSSPGSIHEYIEEHIKCTRETK